MQEKQLAEKYAKLFLDSRNDPVKFATYFLDFHPFPYQEDFLRDQSPRIAACCGRQVGKTTLCAIIALHFALSHNSVRVPIVSVGLRQSMILFDKIRVFLQDCIPANVLLTECTRTRVRFMNGSEIVALPCGRDGSTLRGYTTDLVIIDEANFIPPIVINSVIRPTRIANPNSRLIMISTPWIKDHPFHAAMTKPELGFKGYTWPSRMNPRITPEILELEKRTIGEHNFNREYNAVFLDDEYAYFSTDLVLTCTDEYELNNDADTHPPPGRYYVGIDFGKHTTHSTIAILQDIDNKLHLVYLKEFQLETPYNDVINWTRTLNNAYHFRGGCLDRTGVGERPYEEIERFMPRINGITLTAPVKEDLMGNLRFSMEQQKIILPQGNQRLLIQITSQQAEPLASGKLHFTPPSGANDDQLCALALACDAVRKAPPPLGYIPLSR